MTLVPWRVKQAVRILLARPPKPEPPKVTGQTCSVCGNQNAVFAPLPAYYYEMLDKYGYIHAFFRSETMNRMQYSCTDCGAADRDRLYALYVREFVEQGGELRDILDVAPSKPFTAFLKHMGAVNYRSADLLAESADDRVDIQKMPGYADGQFRIFICSHVLEHVPDDSAAMRELYRVLAPGGWGICMVPINLELSDVYENPAIVDEAGRWKHFGQNDHVRLYSKAGFVSRLEGAGFRVMQLGIEHFGEECFRRHGIHVRSVLYIACKDA
jgi:SAM-dependent methyltransferase